jgi:O-antigen biosynthesis protein
MASSNQQRNNDNKDLTNHQVNENYSDDIIIVNTDGVDPSLPDDDLLTSRKKRITAMSGSNAELISIAVQAYNRLEKTKGCVESILKWTTDFEYELILFDNGSTDGTFEYFKSINHPRKKIIRVTKNVGSVVNAIFNNFSGRYLAYVIGDVYVTKNWLNNLLTCLKSDERIGMVSPVSSNVSLQTADISFNTMDEMQEKAARFNISNPMLWDERLTLFPAVGVFRREALEVSGLDDSGFYHYLVDNDFSFRVRRAGYKLVLCKDTFVHHDHDRTNSNEKDPEESKRSFEKGRMIFKSKYFGIDPWDDVNNFEPVMMSLVDTQELKGKKDLEILGIDVLCGTPLLELKNKCKEIQTGNIRLSSFSTDPKYWLDLKTVCSGNVFIDRIEHLKDHFEDETFNFIVLGKPLNAFPNSMNLFKSLLKLLKKDGNLLLKFHNTFDIISVLRTLGGNIQLTTTNSNPTDSAYQISIDDLVNQMEILGFYPKKFATENWALDDVFYSVLRKTIAASGLGNKPDEIFSRAIIRDYVIEISRK